MVSYTADMFMTLDGFGTGPVGYWGKEGPELVAHRAHVFFAGDDETPCRAIWPDRGDRGQPLPSTLKCIHRGGGVWTVGDPDTGSG